MEVKKIAEEWEIWNEEEEAAKSEADAKKLVPEKFYKWIKVFGKKQSERMPTRKLWNHAIDMKEGFILRKGKVYPLSREEREEVREFIQEQLRKGVMERFDTNIFLSFYLFFLILYFFSFEFLFLLMTRKRHVTSKSHDMSHGVTSQA